MNSQNPPIQSDVLGKAMGRQRSWYIGTKTTGQSTPAGYFLQYVTQFQDHSFVSVGLFYP